MIEIKYIPTNHLRAGASAIGNGHCSDAGIDQLHGGPQPLYKGIN